MKAKLIFQPTEAKLPKLKAYVFKSVADTSQWCWHIKSRNGKIVARDELLHNKADAIKTLKHFNVPIYEV